MDSKKKIGTFKQFAAAQGKKKRLNESDVKIKVDWWDQCIVEVIQDLKDENMGLYAWKNIVEYCRTKYAILGKEVSAYDDYAVLDHIKDLIFQHHGDSLFSDANLSGDKAKIHGMGFVIDELSRIILDKVKVETNKQEQGKEIPPTAQLTDRELKYLEPRKIPAEYEEPDGDECEDDDEFIDDLPFESRMVKGFEAYSTHHRNNNPHKNRTRIKKVDEMKDEDWKNDCINRVKVDLIKDQSTTKHNMKEKAHNYVLNYLAEFPEIGADKEGAADEISDDVVKELKDVESIKDKQEPPARVIARIEKEKVKERPENKFIKLR